MNRFLAGAGWIRSTRYSPNGLLIACGMGGETAGMSAGVGSDGSKRHSPREEDGTIKIVSGESKQQLVTGKNHAVHYLAAFSVYCLAAIPCEAMFHAACTL